MVASPAVAAPEPFGVRVTPTIRRRLAASVYEALLLAAVALLVGFATLPFVAPTPSTLVPSGPVPLPDRAARIVSFGCVFAAWGLYCVGLWSNGRRSLPMKTWKLALITKNDTHPDRRTAFLRYLACWAGPGCAIAAYALIRHHGTALWSVALLPLNYAWALVDRDRQFLQDRLAGTRLVVTKSVPEIVTALSH